MVLLVAWFKKLKSQTLTLHQSQSVFSHLTIFKIKPFNIKEYSLLGDVG